MSNTVRTLVLALCFLLPNLAFPAEEGHDAHHGEDHEEEVRLTESELEEFGIELSTAGPGEIRDAIELPGEVRANEDKLAHIVPRFPGIVKEVRKRIGDSVEAGDVLATIDSSESLSTYELKTLIPGTVIEKHITRGEAVTREREAFVIADLSSVWVDLSVYQRDLPRVRVGQTATVSAGHNLPETEGRISYITPVVSEETRTAIARIELPNLEGTWRPGMFVTAWVIVSNTEVPIAVPRSAVQTLNGKSVVFVQGRDAFSPREVTVGRAGEKLVELTSELKAGERYVSRGAFTLKAELQRESLSGGHAD